VKSYLTMFETVILAVAALAASFAAFFIFFNRDPERNPPLGRDVFVAPADGRIIYVRRVENDQFLWSKKGDRKVMLRQVLRTEDFKVNSGYIMGIYMSPFSVHVNRSPIPGRVTKIAHVKGRFLPLQKEESELLNERNVIVLEHETGFRVAVVQIASSFVGKIDCYVGEGMHVDLGQRIGRVRLGSQVDLVIPSLPKLTILGKAGDKVAAGETVLAEYEPEKEPSTDEPTRLL